MQERKYKREVLLTFKGRNSFKRTWVAESVIWNNDTLLNGLPYDITPVSYTHLDVYKRQHIKMAPDLWN